MILYDRLFFATKKTQTTFKTLKKKHTSHFPVSFEPWNLRRFQPTLAPSSPTWLCAIFKVRRVEFEAKAVDKACFWEWRSKDEMLQFMFQTKFNKKLAWEMVNQNRFDEIDLSQVYI